MSEEKPEGLAFTPSNPRLNPEYAVWVKVDEKFPCSECRARGGWLPEITQADCPECSGEDPYGQPSYCGQCEFCCGC